MSEQTAWNGALGMQWNVICSDTQNERCSYMKNKYHGNAKESLKNQMTV